MLYPNLQYKPSADEMRSICQEVPVYITGEGVGKEVSGGRDLARVPTNNVREGMLLVMCEGMLLKAPKLKKYTDQLKLDGWDFLNAYCATPDADKETKVVFKPKDKIHLRCSSRTTHYFTTNGRRWFSFKIRSKQRCRVSRHFYSSSIYVWPQAVFIIARHPK